MMERSQRIDTFLNTKQLSMLNGPTTLADVFEYMNVVEEEPPYDKLDSLLWTLLRFLFLSEIMTL